MKTFHRICLKDFLIIGKDNRFELKRGREYITSEEENGEVVVFSKFWVRVPANIFGGEIKFT